SERGEILVGPDTHRLTAPLFEFEALDPVTVKGKAEPVSVYRLLGLRAAPGPVRGIAGLTSPLVGRQAELQALQAAVERLPDGGIVTIVGEAGLGKSRLVAEARTQVAGGGAVSAPLRWVEGRCQSHGTATAYLLWLEVLRRLLGLRHQDPPAATRDTLRDRVAALCPDHAASVYPYLGRLLALPLSAEEEAPLRALDGGSLKGGTFRAVACLVEAAARQQPLVIVCEDLQWADPSSVELLEHLLPLTSSAPLLLVCVFRPEGEPACQRIVAAAERHHHIALTLEPLSAGESEALVRNLLHVEGLPPSLRESVLSRAEGNPFYVEEILRVLIDRGAIVLDRDTGRWQATRDATDISIPDTLLGVLMARIDQLSQDTKRVLQMAAVIGRTFLYRVLTVVRDRSPAPAPERETLDQRLSTLQQEQMIREQARVPELEYIFEHHLTQQAAYSGLLLRERRTFHRRVAEALEALFPDRLEEEVELLAYHWDHAAEPEKAVHYLLQAGDRARRLGASQEAISFYRSALDKAAGDVARLRHIHEGLGDVYLENLSRLDEALEHYTAFLSLAEAAEDQARGSRKVGAVYLLQGNLTEAQQYFETALARLSPLPPLTETSRVHFGLAYLFISRNQLDQAKEYARASLAISQQTADTRGLADAYRTVGIIAKSQGDLAAACEYHEQSLAHYRELGDLVRMAQACNNVGDSYRLWGQMDQALERLNEGLEVARRIGDTRDEALLLQTSAELHLDRGQWEPAVTQLEQALLLAQESGVAARRIEVHRLLGTVSEALGQLVDARRHLQTAEAVSRDTQHLRFVPEINLGLAHLSATQGEFDAAQQYLELARAAAGAEPSDVFLGLMHRCSGHLHGQRNDWDEAIACLTKSQQLLEKAHLLAETGKTHLLLGIAYASRGQPDDRGRTCEHLFAGLSIFGRIQARGYLTQTQEWLRKTERQS
ncbi:MAG: tetratricopeptide repeat protein, partial [Chloroflexi bacterium]|nr:tetratricopeptide repeat protein [Chloroflexota bacterium]